MSVAQPQTPPPPASKPPQREITIISHSNLFYWWPVWAVGFVLGLLSLFSGYRMATVPDGTKAFANANVTVTDKGKDEHFDKHDVLVLPPNHRLDTDETGKPKDPRLDIAHSKNFGVVYVTVLLLVIIFTNVPLRGMWSVMLIVITIFLIILFRLAEWWAPIVYAWSLLDIRINAGGYIFTSAVLFIVWLITFLFFDKQIYMVFAPGQLKVCTEIGGGEDVYPSFGTTLAKQRSDFFRHWVLGLGSGDLIVNTGGAQPRHIDLPNVLFVGRKKQMIEDLLRERTVLETK
jgi:hypothetical protein